jgi:phosphoribosylamine--glycine ligase
LLALLESPLASVLDAAAEGRLDEVGPLAWREGAAVCVVVAAENYPAAPVTGTPVEGLDKAAGQDGVAVIQAGTRRDSNGDLVTSGGRILAVTAVGSDVADARARAYAGVAEISIDGSHHRTDIAAGA